VRRGACAALAIAAGGCDLVFEPADLVPAGPPTCTAAYVPVAGAPSRYRIFDEAPVTWPQAEGVCVADSPGETHLVVFDDITELLAVRAAMPSGGWTAHVGYGRNPADFIDSFRAVTGEPLSPVSNLWEPGEPTGPGAEQVTFFTNSEDVLDSPPDLMRIFVCECDGRPETVTFTLP
jgi:hypothetical protein